MNTNKALIVALILVALATGAMGFLYSQSRTQAKLSEALVQAKLTEIADLREQQQITEARALAAENKAAQYAEQLAQLKQKAAENAAALQAKLNAIETAKPSELTDEANRILGTDDIYYNGSYVVMSLATFKKQMAVNYDWENFTLVREPNYEAQIASQAGEIAAQAQAIVEYKLDISLLKKEIVGHEAIVRALRKELAARKLESFFAAAAKYAVGAAAGYAAATIVDSLARH